MDWCAPGTPHTQGQRGHQHFNVYVCNIKREHTQDGAGGRLAGRRAGATSYSRRKTHAEPECVRLVLGTTVH